MMHCALAGIPYNFWGLVVGLKLRLYVWQTPLRRLLPMLFDTRQKSPPGNNLPLFLSV